MMPTENGKASMRVIGITGGVGAGKTSVLRILERESSCRTIVADEAAKRLQEPGQSCFNELVSAFGKGILDDEGRIDRAKLARLIFEDEKAREKVNAIIHPAVNRYITDVINEEKEKAEIEFLFIEAALLIECGYDRICDELWYIYASEASRRKRLKESRGYSDEKISAMFASQLSEDDFKRHCSRIIDNDMDEERVVRQIRQLLDEKRRESGFGKC